MQMGESVPAHNEGETKTNLSEAVKWTDVAQLGITAIGFVLIAFQLWGLRSSTEGDTHADLHGQYMELGKLFLSKPALAPVFL